MDTLHPLFGSDDKVGVWMIILVENEEVTGLLNRQTANGSISRQLSTTSGRGGRVVALRRSPYNWVLIRWTEERVKICTRST